MTDTLNIRCQCHVVWCQHTASFGISALPFHATSLAIHNRLSPSPPPVRPRCVPPALSDVLHRHSHSLLQLASSCVRYHRRASFIYVLLQFLPDTPPPTGLAHSRAVLARIVIAVMPTALTSPPGLVLCSLFPSPLPSCSAPTDSCMFARPLE
ncbi:hypothetical protein BKA93DRAFT_778655 [Sparassis latifolia]